MQNITATSDDINYCQHSNWYDDFKKFTFPSQVTHVGNEFISYLSEDGIILPQSCNKFLDEDQLSDDEDTPIEKKENNAHTNYQFPEVEQFISEALSRFNNEVFIKLNWSAPIDAAWINAGSLKCSRISEIFLLLKSSNRITFDLDHMYDLCEDKDLKHPEQVSLTLKKWVNLNPSMEFRLFIVSKQLIGICQRDCCTFYEFLETELDRVEDLLVKFFNHNIKESFALRNYTIDVHIDQKNRIWIVDFNPFGNPTCSLLFEWHELLAQNTKSDQVEVDFRIIESRQDVLTSTSGSNRGPVDVHLAPEFSKFMEICKQQSTENDT